MRLRRWLEEREQAFVLAVGCNEPLWHSGPESLRADEIVQRQPPQVWQRLSAGSGAKGERVYDWALVELWRLQLSAQERRFGHYLLVRRSLSDPTQLAYYVVFAPRVRANIEDVVKVAGRRWEIEVAFEAAKGPCGLDQYEVRRWGKAGIGISRWRCWPMQCWRCLAQGRKNTPLGLVALSVAELRKLLMQLLWPGEQGGQHVWRWSIWRRQHQYRARQCHYRRRGFTPPS